jgi:hypothetical protein
VIDKFNKNAHPLFSKYFKFDETDAIQPDGAMEMCTYIFKGMAVSTEGYTMNKAIFISSNIKTKNGPSPISTAISMTEVHYPYHAAKFDDSLLAAEHMNRTVNNVVKGLLVSWEFVLDRFDAFQKSVNNSINDEPPFQMTCEMMWEKIEQRMLETSQREMYNEIVRRVENKMGVALTACYMFEHKDAILHHKLSNLCEFQFIVKRRKPSYMTGEEGLMKALDQLSLNQKFDIDWSCVSWSVLDDDYTLETVCRTTLIEAISDSLINSVSGYLATIPH